MKTNKSYILKGGDKWGQGGDKMGTCPPSVVGTRWGQNFIYTPSLRGYKMFCPPVPPCSSPLGGTNKHFVPSLNKLKKYESYSICQLQGRHGQDHHSAQRGGRVDHQGPKGSTYRLRLSKQSDGVPIVTQGGREDHGHSI